MTKTFQHHISELNVFLFLQHILIHAYIHTHIIHIYEMCSFFRLKIFFAIASTFTTQFQKQSTFCRYLRLNKLFKLEKMQWKTPKCQLCNPIWQLLASIIVSCGENMFILQVILVGVCPKLKLSVN